MRKLMIMFSILLSSFLVGCNSEEKKVIEEHEQQNLFLSEEAEIDFHSLEEVKEITTYDSAESLQVEWDGDLDDDTFLNIEADIDAFDGDEGDVVGHIYRAEFTVEYENGEDQRVIKYYYISEDGERISAVDGQ